MAAANLAEVLFSNYRRQILTLPLLHPDESYHVREIARLTGINAGSIHRELKLLADTELLLRETVGRQVYYSANRECQIFEELAGIFRKTAGLADVLRDALAAFGAEIDYCFIFGSVAQGKERVASDVDLFVIGEIDFVALMGALAGTHGQLRREINPVVMGPEEFAQKYLEQDRFVCRVMEEPKIFVRGTANDLGKLVERRSAERTSAG